MTLKDELAAEVESILRYKWPTTIARVVPNPSDIALGDAAKLLEEAVVLYADLDGSTAMVDKYKWWFSAEIYKVFLLCAAKIIRAEDGTITAYDGDRVMAVFMGDDKCNKAVRTALKLNWVTRTTLNSAIRTRFTTEFEIRHAVGIDMSDLHAVRTGVRGDNDIVWVGRAANYAAKLTSLSTNSATRITEKVYDALDVNQKISNDGRSIWEAATWTDMNDLVVYQSTWWLPMQ